MSRAAQSRRLTADEAAAFDPGERAMSAQELRKLIFKLRWIGADDQAELLRQHLMRAAPPGFVALEPGETD
jgi:hypothetical protein